jgi:hypothetical protein
VTSSAAVAVPPSDPARDPVVYSCFEDLRDRQPFASVRYRQRRPTPAASPTNN